MTAMAMRLALTALVTETKYITRSQNIPEVWNAWISRVTAVSFVGADIFLSH